MYQGSHPQAGYKITYYKSGDTEIKGCRGHAFATKSHLHDELSIGIITEGQTSLEIAGKPYTFEAGEAVVIYPGTSHLCKPKSNHIFEFVMVYRKSHSPNMGFGRLKLSKDTMAQVTLILRAILEEQVCEKQIHVLKGIVNHIMEALSEEVILLPSQPVREMERFIAQHADEVLSLNMISKRFHTDQYAMIRAFKGMINTTPSAYKQQIRLSKAKAMLQTDLSIVDVTYALGYYDQSHFVRQFKAVYGLAPSRYKQKLTISSQK
jgi:AraC-like DNA-binding protein